MPSKEEYMKAVVYSKFGPPEVLSYQEIPQPIPADNEISIRVHASAVTRDEPGMRRSPGFNGFIKPKHPVLGEEFAGVVEAVGENVDRFKVGDKVYGVTFFGSHAEYLCIPADHAIVPIPDVFSFKEAAAIPNGVVTALPFLREGGKVKKGDRVLVNGASGSVGTAAVQIAKYFGADVTGVCSGGNADLVRSLGTDDVIDYTKEDFTREDRQYDIIFDTVGKTSFKACKPILAPAGVFMTTVPSPELAAQALRFSKRGKPRMFFMAAGLRKPHKKYDDLLFINEAIEKGSFQAVIDREYTLQNLIEAHRYVEGGHKKGSVVIIHP